MLEGSRQSGSHDGTPSAELGIAKQDLQPRVQRHLDNLQAQVTRILAQYGVSNFEELQALGEENTDNVSKNDIDRLSELAGAIHNVVETGDAPYELMRETTEAQVSVAGYTQISIPDGPTGNLAFYASNRDGGEVIVKEDGSILDVNDAYSNLSNPAIIDGQIAFSAKRNGKAVIVMEDGAEIGSGESYRKVGVPQDANGALAFVAKVGGEMVVVKEDGTVIGKGRDYVAVGDPKYIGDQIVFSAKKEGDWSIVRERGSETVLHQYSYIGDPQDIGGMIAFVANKDGRKFIATEDGVEIGKDEEYKDVGTPQFIGGRVVFKCKTDLGWFVVTDDGEIMGSGFRDMHDPREVNGKVAFAMRRHSGGAWTIMIEGVGEVCAGENYHEIYNFYQIDPTHIAVIARKDNLYVRRIHEIPQKPVE